MHTPVQQVAVVQKKKNKTEGKQQQCASELSASFGSASSCCCSCFVSTDKVKAGTPISPYPPTPPPQTARQTDGLQLLTFATDVKRRRSVTRQEAIWWGGDTFRVERRRLLTHLAPLRWWRWHSWRWQSAWSAGGGGGGGNKIRQKDSQ